MRLSVIQANEKPAYRQLYEQISAAILSGELSPDEMLPSLRFVAKELSISIITVKNAYELLETDGFLYSRQGLGFFVSPTLNQAIAHARESAVITKLSDPVAYAKNAGLSLAETVALVQKLYND